MKVLLCSPLSGMVGGISLWTEHVCNFLKNKPDITLTLLDTARKHNIYPDTPFPERIYKGVQEYRIIFSAINKKLKSQKFDVVHLVSSASFSLLKDYFIIKSSKKKNVPCVIHFHFGRIPDLFLNKNWEYRLLKLVIGIVDHVVVLDLPSYNILLANGFTNVSLLPNPLSPIVDKILDKHLWIERNHRKIMFAGNVIPTKGIFELIEACSEIDNIKIQILGAVTDDVKKKISYTIADVNKFNVVGVKNHETIIKEMLSSRIFVLPSYTEGFPNVILESMAAGCAIISTDVGAIPEMLAIDSSESCGIIVKPKDVLGLRNAIVELLENEETADLLSMNARKRVHQEYSIEKIMQDLIAIWKTAVS